MKKMVIQNVRIETGFLKVNNQIESTLTKLVTLEIESGKITRILENGDTLNGHADFDAQGLLLLPGLTEKHCHLDKSRVGTTWKAVTPTSSIIERVEMEITELNQLPLSVAERAEELIKLYQQAGVTNLRNHVDVHPQVGLSYLNQIVDVLESHSNTLKAETVAFPQHGLLRSDSRELIRQALKNGATVVGGVDPTAVDGNMKLSLETTFSLAVEQGAKIDIHLHERDEMGLATFDYLLELVKKYNMQNKVAVSHAFALGDVHGQQKVELFQHLAEEQVSIMTSVPIDGSLPPIMDLVEAGVTVQVGSDNIFDNWSPYGNGDLLERVGRLGEMTSRQTEYELNRTLGFITEGLTPLDKNGKQIWPKVGDQADFVFVDASCSAEAVARRSTRVATMAQGEIVSGKLNKQ